MLRRSEYLPPAQCAEADRKVLRRFDLEFLSDQGTCSIWEATAVALQLWQSNADQFGRIRHATGQTICPLEAYAPTHARTSFGSPIPLHRCARGMDRGSLGKVRVPTVLAKGATELLSATNKLELVKRFGGWKSDAVHAYLYMRIFQVRDGEREHSKSMLGSTPVLQPQQSA